VEKAEPETASGVADTNSVADRDNTEISHPQTQPNGLARLASASPMQVRG